MLRETAVALLWAAALFRLVRSVQLRHSTSLHSITAALVSIALAGTVTLPVVSDAINEVADTPNFAEAVKNVAIVWAAAFNVLMFFSITKTGGLTRRRVARHLSVAAAVSVLTVVLFLLADPVASYDDFTRQTAGLRWIAESRMAATIYAGVVLASVTRLCFASPRGAIRSGRGLALLGTGTGVMVAYCFARLGFFVSARAGSPSDGLYNVGSVLATVGLALIAVGVLLTPIKEWFVSRREARHLEPLWLAVQQREPTVVIPSSVGGAAGLVEHRVVQIEDGLTLMASHPTNVGSTTVAPSQVGLVEVARWVRDPATAAVNPSLEDLRPGVGQSHAEWVHDLATAFRQADRGRRTEAAPAVRP